MSAPLWRARTTWAQPYRALTWLSAFVLFVSVLTYGATPRAVAYDVVTGWSGTTATTSTLTTASGTTAVVTVSGSTSLSGTATLGSRGWNSAYFSPSTMLTGDTALNLQVAANACATNPGTCTGLGTVTIAFSQPVRNPVLQLGGLGAGTAQGTKQTDLHAFLDLTTAGLTMTALTSAGNLQVVSGTRITAITDDTSYDCTTKSTTLSYDSSAPAVCGSVRVNGVVSTLTFAVGAILSTNPSASGPYLGTTASDAFSLTVTLPQDYSDAPASYNGAQAPAHVLSNLTLGATVDEDNPTVRNATGAPWAAAAANGDDTSGTDDEDAFTTLPDVVAVPGATYSLTVPIAGLSKSATLCGWIDFDRNGTFDTGERQCATPAAGATSATLTWTVTSGVSIGSSNARFRLGYTASQVQSPTGLADSGEVEDYPISFLARPQVVLTKTTTGAVGGPFAYTLTNTTQAAGTATTTVAGTAVQVDGDTATTGTQAYTVTTVNTPVTITEAALAGWSVTSATCTNAGGTVVGSASGAAYTIPAGAVIPGAVITCAYTNAKPGLTFDKQASAIIDLDGNQPDAGDRVDYSFVVTNTGQTTLSGISINDPKVTGISCPTTTVAVGGTVTCTAQYFLTQADVTSGSVVNTASVTANPPTGPALTASDTNTVTIPPNPKISLTKSAGSLSGNTVGSTVTYTFVVLNNGNLPLTSVGVSDPIVGTVTCPVTSLDPGASTTCTKAYTLTQADVDAGTLVNTATASGVSPAAVTVTSTSSATIYIARTATMTLTKTAGTPSGTTAGSTLAYSFLVKNTGNVTLTGIVIADAKVTSYTCPTTTLLPGASTTCTGTHTLLQAEIDAGTVTNQATVTGTPPTGMSAATANGTTTTPLARNPAISLDKQFGGMSGQAAGSTISYSFVVSNTGNVTLTGIWLLDANVPSFSCPTTTLAVGAATTCTGSHTLTQAEIDAGHLLNSATVTGYGPNGAATTATDSVDTTVTPGPGITLSKTAGTPSGNAVGATIAYSFLVKNTGNVTLTSVGVTDPKVGTVSCPVSSLAPGATTTCTKTYTLTQADVDAGSVVNTATASGKTPTNATVQATSSVTTPITRTASFTFDKQAGTPTGTTAGSTITYTFVFQNTGNVTLTALSVSDAKIGSVTCPATLAPGATANCTAAYALTQTDVDAGHVANTATAGATPPSGMTPPTGTDSTDTTIARVPAITLHKTAGTPSGMTAGSTITYTFLVTNSGNVTLTSVGVTDAKVGPVSCPTTTLLPGASTTCTKVYTLTQADADAGVVNNTASASGTPPTGAAVTATDSTSTTITRTATISLVKSAGALSANAAGATLPYTFVVKNTGNVTLTTVGVSDSKVGTVSCPVTSLLPGISTTCTATYTVTQAEVDAGTVNNTATASGTPPTGAAVTTTSSTTTPVTRTPAITLTKSAGAPSGMSAGSTIAYSFLVKNTGNVTLTSVGVSDPKVGTVSCPVSQLAPAATTTCTKTYTLTQADVDAGTVNNTATATGTPPTGSAVTTTSSVVTPITRTPGLTFDKQAGVPTGSVAGSTIAFTFLVTNSGNVTLTSVGVTDAKVGTISCPASTLAPAASTTCTKSYTVTQADVDAGHVANTATATGTPPTGSALTKADSTDTTIPAGPAITLTKSAGAPSGMSAGSTIAYSFLVKNTGNVTLTSVGVSDPKVGTVSCPVSQLAPAATTTCTKSYTLTQADVDAGTVNNTATASGTPPTGAAVTATSSVVTPITRTPGLTFDKQAGVPTGSAAGSTIAYTFIVTNAGNVTLTAVGVTDVKVGAISCPVSQLAPGATTTCTKTYTLTQADVDSGHVANTATATGTPPTGSALTRTDSTDTTIPAGPAITLTKSAGAPSGMSAGATIAYSFLVKNTGNVTLTSVGVTDPKVGTVTCPVSQLAPTATTTCTKTYTLTQADVDAGTVNNTATATGTSPTGTTVTATSSVVTPITRTPAITLTKSAGAPSGMSAGSTIAYSFLVKNTGNVTLTSVGVSDPKVGTVSCPVSQLAPAATTTCTKTYTLTQADVDAGTVNNTATATGTPPTGSAVTTTSSVVTPITRSPAITLDKQAGTPSGTTAGSTIAYVFLVKNTGNVTLTGPGVTDNKVGTVTCPIGSLLPGVTITCTATYTITQTDVDSGHVANTATATASPPSGATVTASDSTDTTIPSGPAITVTKSAGTPSANAAGGTIAYTFLVRNTGNVTLTNVGVTDPKVTTVSCPVGPLAPNATRTCTATYTLTQADVDAGGVSNTATASGTPPTGAVVTSTSSVTTTITRSPAITVKKSVVTPVATTAGSSIAYTFLVTNTGNVTLSGVAVTDAKIATVTCPATQLAPGATTTCTGTYTLGQGEVDSGHVINTAHVTGTSPNGVVVTSTDTITTPITSAPAVTLKKTAGTPAANKAGSTVPYTFLVTNTGNVTLTSVAVTDGRVGTVSCPVTQLAPGAATTCTATYTLTQADVNAGHVINTASVSANPPSGAAVTGTDTVTLPIPAAPALTLDKQAGTATGNTAGSTVPYTFLVTNTGNVTLTGVAVTDARVGTVTCPVTTLAPNASTTCTASYTLTQTDVDAGKVVNTASVSATPPIGSAVTAGDTNTLAIPAAASVTLDKQAGTPSGTAAGATIAYTFIVKNTGNVTLTSVGVTDPKTGPITCPASSLAPGATTTCTKTYTLTQTDVDAGHVANTATASGTTPSGPVVTGIDSTDTAIAAAPAMTLVKSAGTPSANTAGSSVTYTFVVKNTGNVTLTSVGVTDPKVGPVTCPASSLAPGVSTTCTKTYTLTQGDVDAGVVTNTATADGTPPTGTAISATSNVSTPITRSPSLTVDKQAGTLAGTAAGSALPYTFLVTNTGNVTLTTVGVNDPKAGTVSCPVSTLAPSASTTCTATYHLTQTDVDAGHVANTATANGTSPNAAVVTAQDTTDTAVLATPSISLAKTAGTPSSQAAGATITYTFVVTNTGNVTLHAVGVSDPTVGAVSCPATSLAPGAGTTCTKTYTVTQADVDAGVVNNSASVSGTSPSGAVVAANAATTTRITASPAVTLKKAAGTASGNRTGSTVPYTFLVTNTGNVTLTTVGVTDATTGTVTCPVSTLAPGVATTCTATYTLTQADVDAGHVVNTATASGTAPNSTTVTARDTVTAPITSAPSVTLKKTAGTATGSTAGSAIPYTFLVTNTGNVTLTTVAVTDAKVGTVTCPVSLLSPNASTTCTATYTLKQSDVDAGKVVNTATASANPPSGAAVTATDSVTSPITSAPRITLKKTAGTASGNKAGSTIPYTFLVTNTGNVTLTTVGVTDAQVGTVSCPSGSLAPGGSTTCTATYTLTQADVDAGHVTNSATASASPPTGAAVTSVDSITTPIASTPSVTLKKAAGTASGNAAGSTIPYTFLVTNTGNVTLTSVSVSDAEVGTVTCPVTQLAPGAATTCTATYTLKQSDVDAGKVVNTAGASANPPSGTAVSATDSVTTLIPSAPKVTLKKAAGAPTGTTAGSTVPYTFLVTNTGNVTLTSVVVTDARVGTVTCPATTLAPSASTTCAATYALTQADVDAGHVVNSASVSANPPSGAAATATDTVTLPIPSLPAIAVDKQAGTATGNTAGSTIPYTFLVANTGNVTLHAVSVSDLKVGTVSCPVATLAPKASTTCTATYTLTQVDVDSGHVANTATASGTSPTGGTTTASDTVDTPVASAPKITLDKQAGVPSSSTAGATIPYLFVVQNTGNVTITALVISDAKAGSVSCPATTLAPGATTTCTATYTVTQVDVDAGHVANTATASANPPSGAAVTATDSTDTLVAPAPKITLDKQAGTPSGNTAGSTILYRFVVTNTGNVTLTAIAVDDPTAGEVSCPTTVLAPAATTTCTATYFLTQADVDAGHVANTANVSADAPSGARATATDRTDTLIPGAASMVLSKQAGTPSGTGAGSTIVYTFHARNTGNVTMHLLSVTDLMVGSVFCPTTTLAPGEQTTCTATYTLTQADVDAGHVVNTATLSAVPPSGPPVTSTDTATSTITSSPGMTFDKQAGAPSGVTAGSTISYLFVVTNTGNVSLKNVSVTDAKVGTVSCGTTTLSPGAHVNCSATYVLTQADVDAGHVANSASASAAPPSGQPLSGSDSVDTLIPSAPKVTFDKQAGMPTGGTEGSTIPYAFVVTNTGNVTLTGVAVSDAKVGSITCPATSLAPGASTTCTATYTLTQTDIDAGHVANTASVAATPPTGSAVHGTDSTDTPITAIPSISIHKYAGTASGNTAGSVIPYTFQVTNTGNVTLTSVAVADPKIVSVSCPATVLAPKASTTCTAIYTLSQADVDAGHVPNTASVTAHPPTGSPVSASDSIDTLVAPAPRVALDKQSGALSGHTAGSTIPYTFVVTNTGNVTLTAVAINDPVVGGATCPVTTLAPHSSTSCTATYTLTQGDVDAGHVANTASVSAKPPTGSPVTSSDSVDTPVDASPGINITKHAGTATGNTALSTVPYTFDVMNVGEVTLHDIAISDAKVGTVSCPVTELVPGESTTCTAGYTLTQADVDAGHVSNTATVTSKDPSGNTVTHYDTVDAPIPSTPAVTLDKQAGAATGASAGATIPYRFVVMNEGNVTLSSLTIVDPLVGTVSCPVTSLAPSAQTICTAAYTLTQSDVDAGHAANTATVTADPPSGAVVSSTDSTDTLIPASPSLTLDKQAAAPTGTSAGSTIAYSFVVTNTGNVTLHSVSVTDPTAGAVSCPTSTLLPGGRTTCTLTYTLTQADVDAGHVANTATATGTPPIGGAVEAVDSVDSLLPAAPSITLHKTAGTPSGYTTGSTILYSFLVTNTGNVTLSNVGIDDPMLKPFTCPVTTLAPGASVTCTATYAMTQTDVDFGDIDNTASVSATPPIGAPVSASDSTDTEFVPTAVLTLVKQALAPSGNTEGSTIQYSFVASNEGASTLHLLSVSDPKVGSVFCPTTTLLPGDVVTCTATYTLSQADVDAGHVPNTATASALTPTGSPVTATGSKDTVIPSAPSITLDKQAGAPSGTTVGATVPYSFVVTNTGNVTLATVVVDDPLVGPVSCPVSTLAPGGHTTCTATYVVTQADVDAGHVVNTASVSANPPSGKPVSATDSNDIALTSNPSITMDKQSGTHMNTVGSTVPYTFLVTNTGNVSLSGIGISDAKAAPVSCPAAELVPGAAMTCTAAYTLTQADVDAGHLLNTATASGTPPTGATVSAVDSVDTTITAGPQIALDKSAGLPSGTKVGATIAYTFLVTNTGNVTLYAISVDDPKVTAVTCPASQLAPGEDTTCTATYTVKQADVDAGHVVNTASASGTPPVGAAVHATDSTDSVILASPSISLTKSAGTASGSTATSTIPYTFLVTNTGNVTIHGVAVSDTRVGTVTCPAGDVLPGAAVTCSATYALTQADVDLGHVDNSATASATPPKGAAVTAGDSITTLVPPTPSVTMTKTAGTATGNSAGSTIPYSFVVTNTGNVTLHAVAVNDPKVAPVTCPVTQLAPQAQTTCTGTYTITQADADAGHVANSATASATPPAGDPVTATHAIDTSITATPKVTLDKRAAAPTVDAATGTVSYTFLVTNEGSVTLTGITVDDPTVGLVTCPVTTLAPGVSTTCTATYTLTQPDVDAGHLTNSATVSANPPSGPAVTAADSVTTPLPGSPGIALVKTAGTATGSSAGSTVPYTFLVTNTGNVTLTAVGVSDAKVGTVTCPVPSLAPGASETCSASYALTQADVDAGHVANTATASGTPPTGGPTTRTTSVDTLVPGVPTLTLKKTGTASGSTVGSTVSYTFLVTNTGNVTLHGVSVSDPKIATVTCPAASVAPGAATTCTGTYVLTQADVDLGSVTNLATASALSPQGTPASGTGGAVTPISAAPQVTIVKSVGPIAGNTVGTTIPYTFLVSNTGNVTLHGIAVSDGRVGTVICPVTDLAPRTSTTCTATYALTLADVNAGHVANSATVSANPPQGDPVSATNAIDTAITPTPAVTLQKHAGAPSGVVAGSTIVYSLVVTNTGNVTLTHISVEDPLVGTVTCPVTTLDPNGMTTCTVTYAMTQDDIDSGTVVNNASVTATSPLGTDVSDSSGTQTTIPAQPALTLHKSAPAPTGLYVGSTITYSLLVTNTGNVTLGYITVSDPTAGPVSCPDGTLAPNASTTCTVTYTLTQTDIDAGHLRNTAAAWGNPPSGDPMSLDDDATATDTLDTTLVQQPSVAIAKTAGRPTAMEAGGEVPYTFVVTNTGNVTLTGLVVTDPLIPDVSCPTVTLAPLASMTCTGTYGLTLADLDAGRIVNTATVRGVGPFDASVSADGTVTTPLIPKPELAFIKHADATGPVLAGDHVTFTFLVTNTGNVTLSSLKVTDPMLASVSCPSASLAPGSSVLCTGSLYTVTAADAARGWIKNTAVASVLGAEVESGTIELTATSTVTITAVSPPTPTTQLPNTGSPVSIGTLAVSLAILGLGMLLTVVGRRRRDQDQLV